MLSERQKRAVRLLVDERLTKAETARRIGVRRQTVSDWSRKNEAFKEAVRDASEALFSTLEARQVVLYHEAQETALEVLRDGDFREKAYMAGQILRHYANAAARDPGSAPRRRDWRDSAIRKVAPGLVDAKTGELRLDDPDGRRSLRAYIAKLKRLGAGEDGGRAWTPPAARRSAP